MTDVIVTYAGLAVLGLSPVAALLWMSRRYGR